MSTAPEQRDYATLLADACKAAKASSSNEHLDESLYAFVDSASTPIPQNVSRNAVYEKAKSYLACGGSDTQVTKRSVKPNWLDIENFLGISRAQFDIPSKGAIVLTGDNGSGKSSVLEAIVYGAFGETLRGTSPWIDGMAGCLLMSLSPSINVHRTVTKGGNKKLVVFNGEQNIQGTPTKIQDQLSELLPAFDAWSQTHVFSADDAVRFSLSKDADRKKMLEELFGLGRVDRSYTTCMTEYAIAKAKVDITSRTLAAKESSKNSAHSEWSHSDPSIKIGEFVEPAFSAKEPSSPRPDASELTDIAATITHIKAQWNEASKSEKQCVLPSSFVEAMANASSNVVATRKALELAKSGKCPTCARAFHGDHLADAQRAYDEAYAEQQKASEAANQEKNRLDIQRNALDEKISSLRAEVQRLESKAMAIHILAKEWEMFDNAREHHNSYIRELKEKRESSIRKFEAVQDQCAKRLKDAEREFEKASSEHSNAVKELEVIEQVKFVLGPKGMRAHMLSEALTGLENVTNYWLGWMSKMSIRLSSVSEKKDGKGTFDAISMTIVNAKGATYRSLSTGERRRVDSSLVLALSEVVGTLNNELGLVAFDEVFDSLDESGLASVSSAIQELGERRPVLVITHREQLAKSIQGVRYHMTEGRMTKHDQRKQ